MADASCLETFMVQTAANGMLPGVCSSLLLYLALNSPEQSITLEVLCKGLLAFILVFFELMQYNS